MILECPECETPIIGKYSDLLQHVRDEHPLATRLVVDETGKTVEDQIKDAQKDRLKERINEEMVVSPDSPSTTQREANGEGTGESDA